ncbi:gamma-butyrobetaine hydroxylase-like domain-containing protein [Solimicrobium silvestre]|uniref:Gamma-butyrobetaine hydroxylase-like N-terminal domain-containing protein n=1 Tax=Solimicrobium silvestre TaxID=2099400 RepID=A0A2S9H1E0_9BURK|nr:DUF971 domain-containing protein [Solimicrobium silvestre]PRC93801.1 hypothetical protein S2091_1410 [Solimicrobium silvestre]
MNPTAINVRMQSRLVEIEFDDVKFALSFELMRVYSPSAEVRGHGAGQEILQTGKRDVSLTALEPVGHYAVQPHFTDGHNTGIFSWEYLHWLGENQSRLWQEYLDKLQAAGFSGDSGRDAPMEVAGKGCSTKG